MTRYELVAESCDGAPLGRADVFVSQRLDGVSRSAVQRLFTDGGALVNGRAVKPGHKLKPGDRVEVLLPEPAPADIRAEDIPLDILYEDSDLIVVNKRRGMVVHPAAGHAGSTLVNALMFHCDNLSGINGVLRPGIVHRIDKDTSGVLVAAKNDASHRALAAQLAAHSMKRIYIAIVHGSLKTDEGTVDKPIARHRVHRKKMAVAATGGRHAVTHYRVLRRFARHTLIEAVLETGRTHQIRVHMSSIGHPLLGDILYGAPEPRGGGAGSGQALHAMVLGFKHPTTGRYMEFSAVVPDYFSELLQNIAGRVDNGLSTQGFHWPEGYDGGRDTLYPGNCGDNEIRS